MAPVITYGLLQREPTRRRTWLSFDRAPPAEILRQLRVTGWSFRDPGRGWFYPSLTPPLPRGVTFCEGSACDYSSPRPNSPPEVLRVLRRALDVARHEMQAAPPTVPASRRRA
jgi:hypothetical protein